MAHFIFSNWRNNWKIINAHSFPFSYGKFVLVVTLTVWNGCLGFKFMCYLFSLYVFSVLWWIYDNDNIYMTYGTPCNAYGKMDGSTHARVYEQTLNFKGTSRLSEVSANFVFFSTFVSTFHSRLVLCGSASRTISD